MSFSSLHLAHGLWAVVYDFGVTVSEKARSWGILIAGVYALIVMLGQHQHPHRRTHRNPKVGKVHHGRH
ncbi:hypothetical protein [Rothia sp. ZJ932]|uniref:hypothetical protein n=1 Tax=Rothia sp. ZJ932 TaxID=2810516 RepID=UPI0019672C04|nr:hypothetical protein [Rothia sp. ZJ932]QRZ61467.1 hypothetical protein JR346_09640 [Rothia sp. ZJ932]